MVLNRLFFSVSFSVCALIFIIHIFIMYISKKKFKNVENSIFKYLLVGNAVTIIVEFASVLTLYNLPRLEGLANFICKLYEALICLWQFLFIFYILILNTREMTNIEERKKVRNSMLIGLSILYGICLVVMLISPIKYYDYTKSLYVFNGVGTTIIQVLGILSLILTLIAVTLNKKITKKQKLPNYICLTLLFILMIVHAILRIEINLENFMFSLLLITLYFTLENQDNMILEELETSKKAADVANAAQTEFLANMSHEIRTPMNSILGFTESLLNEKELKEDIVKKDMAGIHDAAVTLLTLINNILDISRIESGREKIVEKSYEMKDLIYEINSSILARMPKEVTFQIKANETMPKQYKGDYAKVNKVIQNVIINAICCTTFGSIELKIDRVQENDKNQLIFTVRNSGNVMTIEEFNKNFNDFVHLGVKDDNEVSSAKLGLMVAKQYAKMMNGVISFQTEGGNTIYTIKLPEQVTNEEALGDVFKDVAKDSPEHKLFDLSGKKVLVVDDNKVNIRLACRLLEGYKVEIDTAESGNECIEKVKDNTYDMIFLDHMMPEMDGITTLKLLKSYGYHLPPVIALTANFYTGAKEEYLEQGFNDYLAKPISYKELNKIMYEFFITEDKDIKQEQAPIQQEKPSSDVEEVI